MRFIRNNNVWKINKILAGISSAGVSPEDVQDMIDTSLTDYPDNTDLETALGGKQNTLTAGDGITIENDIISAINTNEWYEVTEHWENLIDADKITLKDIIIIPKIEGSPLYNYYIKKGTNITNTVFIKQNYGYLGINNFIKVYDLLNSTLRLISYKNGLYFKSDNVASDGTITFEQAINGIWGTQDNKYYGYRIFVRD